MKRGFNGSLNDKAALQMREFHFCNVDSNL